MGNEVLFMRPVISGVIGGLIAAWLCSRMARWLPTVYHGRPAGDLVRENRLAIWGANLIFFSGICLGIALYQLKYFDKADWRGLALGMGGGCLGALLIIPLQALMNGRSFAEAYVAFAISQRTPTILLYTIVIVGVSAFSAAMVTLL